MSAGNFSANKSVQLEQLIALNDEMSALVRAGIPLERGLTELGSEMPGRLGRVASFLGERLAAGEGLAQILSNNEERFPKLWRAVVQAGLRSGQLAAALESMATTGRRMADVRRAVGLALLYPGIILAVSYVSFLFLVLYLAPITLSTYEDLTRTSEPFLAFLVWIGRSAPWWSSLVPFAAVVVCALCWDRFAKRLLRPDSNFPITASDYRPHKPNVLRDSRIATFAENLALLLQHETPLHEALRLSAEASGDARLSRAAGELSARLEAGETIAADDPALGAFPPLLGWLMSVGGDPETLSQTFREMADRYRDRALRSAHRMALYLPIAVTVVVGGTVTLCQALAVFVPIVRLLLELGSPIRG